jgi:hypothetical protein
MGPIDERENRGGKYHANLQTVFIINRLVLNARFKKLIITIMVADPIPRTTNFLTILISLKEIESRDIHGNTFLKDLF